MLKRNGRRPGNMKPPHSERRIKLGIALAGGMNGREAALAAGYPDNARTREGVTAAIAKRDPYVQAIISRGREAFAEICFASAMHAGAALKLWKMPKKRRSAISEKQAVDYGLTRHVLQVAGLLAPDTAPPPSASALADALLGSMPPDKLAPLLARAAETMRAKKTTK
jgi:hypothetical protein